LGRPDGVAALLRLLLSAEGGCINGQVQQMNGAEN